MKPQGRPSRPPGGPLGDARKPEGLGYVAEAMWAAGYRDVECAIGDSDFTGSAGRSRVIDPEGWLPYRATFHGAPVMLAVRRMGAITAAGPFLSAHMRLVASAAERNPRSPKDVQLYAVRDGDGREHAVSFRRSTDRYRFRERFEATFRKWRPYSKEPAPTEAIRECLIAMEAALENAAPERVILTHRGKPV